MIHRAMAGIDEQAFDAEGRKIPSKELAAMSVPPEDPFSPDYPGAPLQYQREIMDRAFWEIAAHAGNCRKASLALQRIDIHIPHETLYRWIRGRFKGYYEQLQTRAAEPLREVLARQAIDLALETGAAEKAALKQVFAQMADVNAVEASMILRNLSQSKGLQLDQEGKIRGRAGIVVDHRGLQDLTDALVNLGAAQPVDVTDADVVEET